MRIRDAVHGDIDFQKEEEDCIRSPVFQRLHTIKQLGNAFHVYPSAMHTRFEHSLGVCYQVKKILASIRKRGRDIDSGEERLLSIAGLLHDITHTPFKHTLERDSGLFEKEPLDTTYRRRFEQMCFDSVLKNQEIDQIVRILAEPDSYQLNRPYQAQMIQDTFSADLLDYARRDTRFTGITRDYDERIYDHIGIVHFKDKDCFGVNLTDEFGRNTASAMTELINLLEVRYVLNERVYFYPTKIAADSLLVKGFRVLLTSQSIQEYAFEEMSDEEVINFLANCGNEDASFYGKGLKNRVLPRVARTLRRSDFPKEADFAKIVTIFRGSSYLDKWADYEARIAKEAGTDSRNVIIYCHDPDMQQKKDPQVLVWDESANPYFLSKHERCREVDLISDKHRDLWGCHVFFLDRDADVLKKIGATALEIMLSL